MLPDTGWKVVCLVYCAIFAVTSFVFFCFALYLFCYIVLSLASGIVLNMELLLILVYPKFVGYKSLLVHAFTDS